MEELKDAREERSVCWASCRTSSSSVDDMTTPLFLHRKKIEGIFFFLSVSQLSLPAMNFPPFEQPLFDPNQAELLEEAERAKNSSIPFHNPFDVNSYPITNPPIFDSTMTVPYTTDGVPRRRRISISNAQIGQIVSHEAYFAEDLDVPPEFESRPQTSVIEPPPPPPPQPQPQLPVEIAGVPPPNHQLIYNNEVIYNPENGPIPGTAAWKKERLLERNRIAASKCRQRKKQEQVQIQNNIAKMEKELKKKDAKIAELEYTVELLKASIKSCIEDGNTDRLKQFI